MHMATSHPCSYFLYLVEEVVVEERLAPLPLKGPLRQAQQPVDRPQRACVGTYGGWGWEWV